MQYLVITASEGCSIEMVNLVHNIFVSFRDIVDITVLKQVDGTQGNHLVTLFRHVTTSTVTELTDSGGVS